MSPLRRAIYTAFYTFDGPRLRNGSLKMIVVPSIQETSAAICDQGLPLSQLKAELTANDVPIDLSLLDEDWNVKVGLFGLFFGFSSCPPFTLSLLFEPWYLSGRLQADLRGARERLQRQG